MSENRDTDCLYEYWRSSEQYIRGECFLSDGICYRCKARKSEIDETPKDNAMLANEPLKERLLDEARQESRASKMLADAKTARQTDRDDYPKLAATGYAHIQPEETTRWKAADTIACLEAAFALLETDLQDQRTAANHWFEEANKSHNEAVRAQALIDELVEGLESARAALDWYRRDTAHDGGDETAKREIASIDALILKARSTK